MKLDINNHPSTSGYVQNNGDRRIEEHDPLANRPGQSIRGMARQVVNQQQADSRVLNTKQILDMLCDFVPVSQQPRVGCKTDAFHAQQTPTLSGEAEVAIPDNPYKNLFQIQLEKDETLKEEEDDVLPQLGSNVLVTHLSQASACTKSGTSSTTSGYNSSTSTVTSPSTSFASVQDEMDNSANFSQVQLADTGLSSSRTSRKRVKSGCEITCFVDPAYTDQENPDKWLEDLIGIDTDQTTGGNPEALDVIPAGSPVIPSSSEVQLIACGSQLQIIPAGSELPVIPSGSVVQVSEVRIISSGPEVLILPPPPAQPEVEQSVDTGGGCHVQTRLKEAIKRRRAEAVQGLMTEPVPAKKKRAEINGSPPLTKKERRRQQNREAARRFREKQLSAIDELTQKLEKQKDTNTKLKAEMDILARERDRLKRHVDGHLKVCPAKNKARVIKGSGSQGRVSTPQQVVTSSNNSQQQLTIASDSVNVDQKIWVEITYQDTTVVEEKTLAEVAQLLSIDGSTVVESSPSLNTEENIMKEVAGTSGNSAWLVGSTGGENFPTVLLTPAPPPGKVKNPTIQLPSVQKDANLASVLLTPDSSPVKEQPFHLAARSSSQNNPHLPTSVTHTPEPSPTSQSPVFTFEEIDKDNTARLPVVPPTPSPDPTPPTPPTPPSDAGHADCDIEMVAPDVAHFDLLKFLGISDESAEDDMICSNTPTTTTDDDNMGTNEQHCDDISPLNEMLPRAHNPVRYPDRQTPGAVASDWSAIQPTDFCLTSLQMAAYNFDVSDDFLRVLAGD